MSYDQVGSLRVVADSSGNVVKRIEYDSFGNIIEDTDPSFNVPFGFAGGLHDRDTGLVRFGYRDYDPDVGRWTAKDPILFEGGDTDLYGYCLNDPINLLDSDGKSAMEIAGPIAFGISQLDSPIPGPADLVAGAIIAGALLIDTWPDRTPEEWKDWAKEHDENLSDNTCPEERTPWQGPGDGYDPDKPPPPNKNDPLWKKIMRVVFDSIRIGNSQP